MKKSSLAILVTLFVIPVPDAFSQDEISKRRAELESIRDEISAFEKKIQERRKSEDATLELLDDYDRKTSLVRSLIAKIRSAERKIETRIGSLKGEIGELEEQLAYLKEHYAKYVTSVYKAGRANDFELLMTARSVNQAFIRSEYLNRFIDQRKKDAARIMEKRDEIERLQLILQEDLTEQRRLLASKGAEEDRLEVAITDKRGVLTQIRKDRKAIQREIDRKLEAAKELEGMIARLIETERLRKEKAGERLPPPPPVTGTGFGERKGKLRWPVAQGSVVAKFGNQKHPTLKTVTENPGIDISVKPGTPVLAVASGRVARIWWLVSYGNLIILDHGDGYRTIYAHLADIMVTEGQNILEGDAIATSGETLDGSRLHFEIWKERDKQNPEQWLARR